MKKEMKDENRQRRYHKRRRTYFVIQIIQDQEYFDGT